jgi:hypothetical protein
MAHVHLRRPFFPSLLVPPSLHNIGTPIAKVALHWDMGGRNLGSQTPLMDLTFRLKIGPMLEEKFLKVREVFSIVGINKIGGEIDATLMPLDSSIPWTQTIV